MTLDASRIAPNNSLVFEAGQISFSVDICKVIVVKVRDDEKIVISKRTSRPSLVTHTVKIMQAALNVKNGFDVDIDDKLDLRHTGLGSSGSIIAGTAAAINEIYGKPINNLDLAQYCIHNYGEEIEGESETLAVVQSVGGSSICGFIDGGLVIVTGKATPIFSCNLDQKLVVSIGIPKDYVPRDAKAMMQAELENMEGFENTGKNHAPEIAYRLVHEVLPGLVNGDLKPCKKLIFDYRWDMGSIKSCSFVYPRMIEIAENLRDFKDDERIQIIAPSSVGPAFFALSYCSDYVKDRFNKLGLKTIEAKIHNSSYTRVNYL